MDHIETCDVLIGCTHIRKYANKLKDSHILDWSEEDRNMAIVAYA